MKKTASRISPALAALAALLLAAGCGKVVPEGPELSSDPLFFRTPETKATQTNKSMGPTYDTEESFVTYAAFSEAEFDPSGAYEPFWDANGLACTYNSTFHGWAPAGVHYWPKVGYLSFRAYSPAGAPHPSFSWTGGFTWTGFSVPAAGSQYDLMYSDLVTNCRRSNYTPSEGGSYDDDLNYEFIYKGVNIKFRHALSLVEVQASSALGSYSSIKYYIQSVVLHNAYDTGDFASSSESWTNISHLAEYTLLDLSGEADPGDRWKVLPGSDEYPVSVHPDVTLMLLPQELDRASDPAFSTSVDAYLTIVYKCSSDDVERTTTLPLTDSWERGNKYTYKLVFSSDIEFTASISAWDDDITYGSYLIVQ